MTSRPLTASLSGANSAPDSHLTAHGRGIDVVDDRIDRKASGSCHWYWAVAAVADAKFQSSRDRLGDERKLTSELPSMLLLLQELTKENTVYDPVFGDDNRLVVPW